MIIDGFYLLLSKLDPLDPDSIIIGLEGAAHYGNNLVRFLIARYFFRSTAQVFFHLLNSVNDIDTVLLIHPPVFLGE